MARIFISYSREDSVRVREIMNKLEDLGVSIWNDQDIGLGANWSDEMEKALHEATAFVLFLTPRFLSSEWCNMELGIALSREQAGNARVIPVLLTDAELPTLVKRFQFIDATNLPPNVIAEKIQTATQDNV